MKRASRGDVWLTDFGTPIGREQGFRRPAVVLSSDRLNHGRSGLVIVVPTTTARRDLPTHVELEPGETGLQRVSYAKVEDLKSVSIDRLVDRFGVAPPEAVERMERAAVFLLGL